MANHSAKLLVAGIVLFVTVIRPDEASAQAPGINWQNIGVANNLDGNFPESDWTWDGKNLIQYCRYDGHSHGFQCLEHPLAIGNGNYEFVKMRQGVDHDWPSAVEFFDRDNGEYMVCRATAQITASCQPSGGPVDTNHGWVLSKVDVNNYDSRFIMSTWAWHAGGDLVSYCRLDARTRFAQCAKATIAAPSAAFLRVIPNNDASFPSTAVFMNSSGTPLVSCRATSVVTLACS